MTGSPWSWICGMTTRRRRVQFMSDLHPEVGGQYSSFQIPVRAPDLILAGDIGRLCDYDQYLAFLRVQCSRFDHVYLVLGNHEFYGVSRVEGLRLAASLQREQAVQGRLIILNRTRLDLSDRTTLLGCTLYSRIQPQKQAIVENRVKDFSRIHDWTVADHNAEHEADAEGLRSQIAAIRSEKANTAGSPPRIFIVAHHAPTKQGSSQPHQQSNAWSDAFATDLIGDESSAFSGVSSWIFGHTHYTTAFCQHGVDLVSNQRGYVLNGSSSKKPAANQTGFAGRNWLALTSRPNDHQFSPERCNNFVYAVDIVERLKWKYKIE